MVLPILFGMENLKKIEEIFTYYQIKYFSRNYFLLNGLKHLSIVMWGTENGLKHLFPVRKIFHQE